MRLDRDEGWLVLAGILLLLDQVLKFLFVQLTPFIDLRVLKLHLVWNTGASFSILQHQNSILIYVALIVLGVFLWQFEKIPARYRHWGILAAAGIIGNVIDRLLRGAVVDFIDFGWFPVFNVADSLISISVIAILVLSWLEEKKKKNVSRTHSRS